MEHEEHARVLRRQDTGYVCTEEEKIFSPTPSLPLSRNPASEMLENNPEVYSVKKNHV